MSDNTPLGDRMKVYERASRYYLPRRSYGLLRVDGKAFHTYLKDARKPFDMDVVAEMGLLAQILCQEIQGAKFAYHQSDEISILFTDFDTVRSEQWGSGRMDKILSWAAGTASSELTRMRYFHSGTPVFDARVWSMTDPVEVANYFLWRQQDAVRNSIQMVGQHYFTQPELFRKSCDDIQEMLFQERNINWNDFPVSCKRGQLILPVEGEGWCTVGAPHFKAEPGTELARLIPPMSSLVD